MGLQEVVVVVVLVLGAVVVGVRGTEEVVVEGCTAPVVVFGASMVDVGQNAIAQPFTSISEFVPYGVDYFGAPAARFSNGRVISDFISLGLGYGLMEPYFNSVNPQFTHGVSFASSGSTAQNSSTQSGSSAGQGSGLFPLNVQVSQYKLFKDRVAKVQAKHNGSLSQLPTITKLGNAIHVMMQAHNDYINAFTGTASYEDATLVANVITAIEASLRELYRIGAKTMIVMNVLPLGCIPGTLASAEANSYELNNNSCVASFTNLVELHNTRLQELIVSLRKELSWDGLVVFDLYAFYMDALLNPSKYDIKYPFQACCGVGGGKYNVHVGITCGSSGTLNGVEVKATRCDHPTEHISWDGLHPTESFAKYIANALLGGQYFNPSLSMKDACKA